MNEDDVKIKIEKTYTQLRSVNTESLRVPLFKGLCNIAPADEMKILLLAGLFVDDPLLLRDYAGSRLTVLLRQLGNLIKSEGTRKAFHGFDGTRPLPDNFSLAEQCGACNVLHLQNVGHLPPNVLWDLTDLIRGGQNREKTPLLTVATMDHSDTSGRTRFSKSILHDFLLDATIGELSSAQARELLGTFKTKTEVEPTLTLQEIDEIRRWCQVVEITDEDLDRFGKFLTSLSESGKVTGRPSIEASRSFLNGVKAVAVICSAVTHEAVHADWELMRRLAPLFLGHRVYKKEGTLVSPSTIIKTALESCTSGIVGKEGLRKISNLEEAHKKIQSLRNRLCEVVKGRHDDGEELATIHSKELSTIDLILTAMVAEGHVLLEDYPGSGKSYLSKILGESIVDDIVEDGFDIQSYRRIQCTPDLLPSDITGYNVPGAGGEMHFRHGPIFAYVVLLDEINRTTPKVQSAMLEAMAEKQVTVDGRSYDLGEFFFVIATMNPLDKIGTFPLPQAQLDRFLFKRTLSQITDWETLRKIVKLISGIDDNEGKLPVSHLNAIRQLVHSSHEGNDAIDTTQALKALFILGDKIGERCVIDPKFNSKKYESDRDQLLGPGSRPSARTLQRCLKALRAYAFIKRGSERNVYISPEDVGIIARDILRHRIFPLHPVSDSYKREKQICRIIDAAVADMLESLKDER